MHVNGLAQGNGEEDSEGDEFFDPSEASPARTGSSPLKSLSRRLSSVDTPFFDADDAMPGELVLKSHSLSVLILPTCHAMKLRCYMAQNLQCSEKFVIHFVTFGVDYLPFFRLLSMACIQLGWTCQAEYVSAAQERHAAVLAAQWLPKGDLSLSASRHGPLTSRSSSQTARCTQVRVNLQAEASHSNDSPSQCFFCILVLLTY